MDFDHLYRQHAFVWWKNSDEVIKKALPYIKWKNILDLWVGDGRNALFLLENNYYVDCVDISSFGLKNIEKHAQKIGKKEYLNTLKADLRT